MRTLHRTLVAFCLTWLASFAIAQTGANTGYVERQDGARIYYKVSGQGKPIFLIHGYPLSGELFQKNRSALENQYQVITIDQRGYGQSKAPDSKATIQTYANDALAVMGKLGIQKAIIGGMSMGGPIVFEMYRNAPERFSGMILMNTTAVPANEAEAGLWKGIAQMVEKKGVNSLDPFLIKDMFTGQTRMQNKELVNAFGGIIKNASKEGAIAGANALATRPDSQSTLGKINVPTLVIVGIEDTIYPVSLAQDMQKAIPNAKLAIIDGASHAAVIENPDQVNKEILNWAKQVKN
jgi:pimeloyl-ACP methyl ester carboxylesterase